jgi:hypothetical protein
MTYPTQQHIATISAFLKSQANKVEELDKGNRFGQRPI